MREMELKWVLEALLMSSSQPLTLDKMQSIFDECDRPTHQQLQNALELLNSDYANRAIEVKFLASGYSLQTKVKFSRWIVRLFEEKPAKYSTALLETLAIIAYKQPVTRADIEDIRGVAVSSPMIKTLLEREWIRVAGHRDVPGKPAVYMTTKKFLDYFNLKSLSELPDLVDNVLIANECETV